MDDVLSPDISLLWPKKPPPGTQTAPWPQALVNDLDLERLVSALGIGSGYTTELDAILEKSTDDEKVIQYRLDILEDLLQNPKLCTCFQTLLPSIRELSNTTRLKTADSELDRLIARVGVLSLYVDCVHQVAEGLASVTEPLVSQGLTALRSHIGSIMKDSSFQTLTSELPKMQAGFEKLASVTIGVNLDAQLRPSEAVLVSVNDEPYKAGTLIERLMNIRFDDDAYRGISPLQVVSKGRDQESEVQNMVFRQSIMDSIHKIIKSVLRPVAPLVAKYTTINGQFFMDLGPELVFLLGEVQLVKRLQALGMSMVKPVVRPKAQRECRIKGMYNLHLALSMQHDVPDQELHQAVVPNNVIFDDDGRIFILTGPNQGGKTVYTQGVGVAQFLFQLGMYVPGKEAFISPVDCIYTHFPVEEKPDSHLGRMGEECQRLHQIFSSATKHSLVLLNESLSSTSPGEAVYIARELVQGLKLLQTRAIFATHFHELGENLATLNQTTSGDSQVVSLVAGVCEQGTSADGFSQRSFHVRLGPPQGLSYAKEIASRYGVSTEKITATLKERNILDEHNRPK